MSNTECTVFDSFSQINQSLEKEWDDLVVSTFAGIYMTFRWSRTWWEFYGGFHKLRIFFFRQKGQLVAVFPIYIQRVRTSLFGISIARLLGSNIPPRVFDPPVDSDQACELTGLLVEKLVKEEACDVVSLGPVSEQWANRTDIRNSAKQDIRDFANLKTKSYDAYTYYKLPNSFDEYYSSLSHKERRIRRQKMNNFNKDFNPRIEVLMHPSDIDKEIGSFVEMHNFQWNQEGRPGYFGAWPNSTAFNKKLAHEFATMGKTWLVKVVVNEKPTLYQYAFIFGERCYWQLSARIWGESWERYSLGATNALFFLQHCIKMGVNWVESGLGSYEYKKKLGGIEELTLILRYNAKRLPSRLKYLLFRAISACIGIFYHKIYYKRIQPRLPVRLRRPIWTGWIRLSI